MLTIVLIHNTQTLLTLLDNQAAKTRRFANAPRTKKSYNTYLKHYFTFCDKVFLSPLTTSDKQLSRFLEYLRLFTTVRHSGACAAVSAVTNYWAQHGISFSTKQHPIIRMQLKGYHRLKPSSKILRKPFNLDYINQALEQHIIKPWTFSGALMTATFTCGYFKGMRVGEYTIDKQSKKFGDLTLKRKHLSFDLNKNRKIIGSVILIEKSKTNQFGDYHHPVSIECSCPGFCGPHSLFNYLALRTKKFGKIQPEDPLLIDSKQRPLKASYVTNIIRNTAAALELDPKNYHTHSLRIGGATDLARANVQAYQIEKWGRWRSGCWKEIYAQIDFRDLAKLTHSTVAQWTYN